MRHRIAERALVACLLSLLPTTSIAGDGVIEINQARALAGGITASDAPGFPITLDAGGSYKLTSNLVNLTVLQDTIQLTASLITLDLNGFYIQGPAQCSFGASGVSCTNGAPAGFVATISGLTNCPFGNVVRNGTIFNASGSAVALCASSRVENITVIGAHTSGILVNEGSIVLRANIVLAGNTAIVAPSSEVLDSTVRDSGRSGDGSFSGISGVGGAAVGVRGVNIFRVWNNEYFENSRSLGPSECDGLAC